MTSQSIINKRKLILNAALDLFVKYDIGKTSTASIAKKGGVSNGTLFHYFPTKNDLIAELYLLHKTEMFDFIYTGNLKETESVKEMIRNGCMNAVNWITANKQKHSYIHKIYKSTYIDLIKEEKLHDTYKHYLSTISKGIEHKTLKNIPTELMVNIINNQISALADYYINNNININESLNNQIFEMIWECIKH